jgi:hypothetical protein
MNFRFPNAIKVQHLTGVNWQTATLKALAVMTNSTAGADRFAQFLSGANGFVVLDEFDGAGYARVTLSNVAVTLDLVTGEVVVTCDPASFGAAVSNGSRSVAGFVVYLDGASDAARVPLIWIDSVASGPTFPYSPGGQALRLVPGTRGLFRARSKSPS